MVQSGLALSGTLHWMFDKGLVAVDADHTIVVAKGSVADQVVARHLTPDRRLILPSNQNARPHGAFLDWHRQNRFKGQGVAPWNGFHPIPPLAAPAPASYNP